MQKNYICEKVIQGRTDRAFRLVYCNSKQVADIKFNDVKLLLLLHPYKMATSTIVDTVE